jgi:hypothetical protein
MDDAEDEPGALREPVRDDLEAYLGVVTYKSIELTTHSIVASKVN